MKKIIKIVLAILFVATLFTGCGKKNNLSASDFPLIKDGLTEDELISKVGNPHKKIANSLEIMSIQANVLSSDLSNGSYILDYEKSWNVLTDGEPEKCYIYQLENSDRKVMMAFIKDSQVIMITRQPVEYTD